MSDTVEVNADDLDYIYGIAGGDLVRELASHIEDQLAASRTAERAARTIYVRRDALQSLLAYNANFMPDPMTRKPMTARLSSALEAPPPPEPGTFPTLDLSDAAFLLDLASRLELISKERITGDLNHGDPDRLREVAEKMRAARRSNSAT